MRSIRLSLPARSPRPIIVSTPSVYPSRFQARLSLNPRPTRFSLADPPLRSRPAAKLRDACRGKSLPCDATADRGIPAPGAKGIIADPLRQIEINFTRITQRAPSLMERRGGGGHGVCVYTIFIEVFVLIVCCLGEQRFIWIPGAICHGRFYGIRQMLAAEVTLLRVCSSAGWITR